MIVGAEDIVNTLSLTSFIAELLASLILTLHCVDGVLGIAQLKLPSNAVVEGLIFNQLVPLFVVYSILR